MKLLLAMAAAKLSAQSLKEGDAITRVSKGKSYPGVVTAILPHIIDIRFKEIGVERFTPSAFDKLVERRMLLAAQPKDADGIKGAIRKDAFRDRAKAPKAEVSKENELERWVKDHPLSADLRKKIPGVVIKAHVESSDDDTPASTSNTVLRLRVKGLPYFLRIASQDNKKKPWTIDVGGASRTPISSAADVVKWIAENKHTLQKSAMRSATRIEQSAMSKRISDRESYHYGALGYLDAARARGRYNVKVAAAFKRAAKKLPTDKKTERLTASLTRLLERAAIMWSQVDRVALTMANETAGDSSDQIDASTAIRFGLEYAALLKRVEKADILQSDLEDITRKLGFYVEYVKPQSKGA